MYRGWFYIASTSTTNDGRRSDKIKFIAEMHVSVYRTSIQLQIDECINSTSIKQLGGK